MSFDLTSRPWLPVQLITGEEDLLSLREVFARADGIRRLAGDLPTQDFALSRLLLAILHDAVDGPQDTDVWAELWENRDAFADVPDYLDRYRDRFDLLHPHTPFFQSAGLHTASGEVFSLNRIVADVPNGDPFFTTRFPRVQRLSFAEAARWVVHAQAYDTSGIKTGVVGDPRVKGGKAYPQGVAWAGNLGGVLAEGTTLRESLLLNLIAADHQPGEATDRPAWRRPPPGPGAADDLAARPAGLRDLYTWQSRRMLLHADASGVHGVVLTYGDPLAVQNMQHIEPMTGWRRSQAQEKKLGKQPVYMPREHDPARAAWRGLEALITPRDPDTARRGEPASGLRPGIVDWIARLQAERILPRGRHIRVRTFGAVYGTQQSVIDEITSDTVSLAVLLLSDTDRALGQTAVDAVADADRAVLALGDLAFDLARAAGSESESGKQTARDAAYAALDGPYRLWLDAIGEGDDPQQLRTAWQCTARRIVARLADDVINTAGETAWQGRLVSSAKGQTWLNADLADLWFRSRLNKALPLAADSAAGAVPAQKAPTSDTAGSLDAALSPQKVTT
ncbi:type I-E CRISPR-associated protein Cse1/CasA [Actinacidiphila glaucinigra]|uniref:type I-E CRISPR-associated protein Cse1/CasA n=1 Tax=Actinacidiphila glaucinigra TaxID=235986 RepID=UPI000B772471|nr:type I-E CRISPR-associated protein Cse1/CasA [Actinacidiphila glaucinigra]